MKKVIVILLVAAVFSGAGFYFMNFSRPATLGMPASAKTRAEKPIATSPNAPVAMRVPTTETVITPADDGNTEPLAAKQATTPYRVVFQNALKDVKQGVPGALYRLDNAITACEGVPQDETGYQAWVARHANDNMPDFDAMRVLMARCKDTPSMTFDTRETLYRSYAEKGSSEGAFMLGALYGYGTLDSEKWLEKAAREGNVHAASMLAETYASPASDGADNAKAYLWYLVASQLGDKQATASAAQIAETLDPGKVSDAQNQARALAPGIQQVSEN